MNSKHRLLYHTESYREAEKKHTILLPVAMILVVGISYWLVSVSRPAAPDTPEQQTPENSAEKVDAGKTEPDRGTVRDISVASPPKSNPTPNFAPDSPPARPSSKPAVTSEKAAPAPASVPVAKILPQAGSEVPDLDALTPPGRPLGDFTPWLTPSEMNEYIAKLNEGYQVSFWDRGYWITAVEGRMDRGVHQYRIVYEKAPTDADFQWRYRIAQTGRVFAENIETHRNLGFTLVHSQMYVDENNQRLYQAVWHRVN